MDVLKIKVCGLRDIQNINEIIALEPDYVGFIFYDKSPRYIGAKNIEIAKLDIPYSINKTGVFVNASHNEVINAIAFYNLKAVQLHGNESVDYCRLLKDELETSKLNTTEVIKAISINDSVNFNNYNAYIPFTNYFLLDTSTVLKGGSGNKFNWSLLLNYNLNHKFFLSGGIEPNDAIEIINIDSPMLVGIDINSKFEISPGLKNTSLVKTFIKEIRDNGKLRSK